MEKVSSHFYYTEEYCFGKSFPWLQRKFKQADKEQWESQRRQMDTMTRSIMLIVDNMFNDGKGSKDLIMPAYDEAIQQDNEQQEQQGDFIQTTWWKPEQSA